MPATSRGLSRCASMTACHNMSLSSIQIAPRYGSKSRGGPTPAATTIQRAYDCLTGEGDRVDRSIRTIEDVLRLLDGMFAPEADRWTAGAASWWDRFYADRSREVPFFVAKPDENLLSYLDRGLIGPGRVLDLGCGPGR
jgi:hypothetical protein